MPETSNPSHRRGPRAAGLLAALLAGAAAAVLVGVASAKTFTLNVATKAKVTNTSGMTKTESIVVNSQGRAVYYLTGDTPQHPECTKANGCFKIWIPVSVSSPAQLTRSSTVTGKLTTGNRGGLTQVLLRGHPLYTFAGDQHAHDASGEGIRSFHGTWHVATASSGSTGSRGSTTSTTTNPPTPTTPTTPTTPCYYPPCL